MARTKQTMRLNRNEIIRREGKIMHCKECRAWKIIRIIEGNGKRWKQCKTCHKLTFWYNIKPKNR